MSVQAGAGATWKQSSLKSKVARDGAMMVLVKSATKTRMVAVATPEDPLVHCATRGSTRVFAKAIKIGADTLEKRNLKAELPTGMDSVFSGGADCKATSAKVGAAVQHRTRAKTR